MKVFPETYQRIEQYYRALEGKSEKVPILAQINEHVVKMYGGQIREAYTNAAKFVEMNLAIFQYYLIDIPGFYYDIYNIEAEALGQKMNWETSRMPNIDRSHPLIQHHTDLDHLRPPDFRKSGRMPFVLEGMRRCYDLGLPVRIRFCSPFSLACNVRGIDAFMMDILTEPQFAHRLLTFLTEEVLVPWVEYQREATGQAKAPATGADAAASPPITNIEILEEFVMPYVQRMDELSGSVSSIGYWGYSYFFHDKKKFDRMLELMVQVSPRLLLCMDPDVAITGPEPYAQFANSKKMFLMLGLDSMLLQEGPIDKIIDRCRNYILAGAKERRMFFFLNDISLHTPPEHVHAAIAAIRYFGQYPIEERPLESFKIPIRESFEAFMEHYQKGVSM